jgi:hypothetical protein
MTGTPGKGDVGAGSNHLGFRCARSLRMEEAVK